MYVHFVTLSVVKSSRLQAVIHVSHLSRFLLGLGNGIHFTLCIQGRSVYRVSLLQSAKQQCRVAPRFIGSGTLLTGVTGVPGMPLKPSIWALSATFKQNLKPYTIGFYCQHKATRSMFVLLLTRMRTGQTYRPACQIYF